MRPNCALKFLLFAGAWNVSNLLVIPFERQVEAWSKTA